MGQEIERKFVLKKMPAKARYLDHMEVPCIFIEQGYLSEPGSLTEVRIRRAGRHFFLTTKSGAGCVREEDEVQITADEYAQLRKSVVGNMITKNRYLFRENGHVLEVDEYTGSFSGLVVLEVEFSSLEEADAFILPSWAQPAQEATEDTGYKNVFLAQLQGL